ncbi:effector-associated constant component EACC1 [Streptomyces tubercidicus]
MDEPELQAGVSLEAEPSEPGQMGGGLELVNVVLSNSIALASLVTAVATWRGSRARPPQIRLERDGVVVTLQDGSPEAVEQILRVWSEGERGQGDEGGAPGSGARGRERG